MRSRRLAIALLGLFAFTLSVLASGDHPVTASVTIWTDKGELFMEYVPPVVGKPARFTAHLTELAHFRAVVHASATSPECFT